MLGVGVVLTWDGRRTHRLPGDTCITEAVNGYLIDLHGATRRHRVSLTWASRPSRLPANVRPAG